MNWMGWRGPAAALALVLAATAGWSTGRILAPHAVAQDPPAQNVPTPDTSPPPPPVQQAVLPPQAAPPASAEERGSAHLASILAPVALYPDALLGNILAASTYPLEVVEADRWLDQPANAALAGDQLEAALQQKDWDPAVKSLVPFRAVLKMMDNQLDWTQQLGDAFLSEPDQVMDMVQQLRGQAQAAGGLISTPQQRVSTDSDGAVEIEPTNQQEVSVPAYDPNAVYGDWPYPEAPPDAFAAYGPDVAGFGYGDGWYFGTPVVLASPVWFWGRCDWHHHRIEVNHDRFARLSDAQHRFNVPVEWQHDPAHRHGVAYREAGLEERFHPERNAALRAATATEPSHGMALPAGGFPAARPGDVPHFTPAPAVRPPAAAPALQPVPTMAHTMSAPPAEQMRAPVAPVYRPVQVEPPRPVMQQSAPAPAFTPRPAAPTAPARATGPAAGGGVHGGFQR